MYFDFFFSINDKQFYRRRRKCSAICLDRKQIIRFLLKIKTVIDSECFFLYFSFDQKKYWEVNKLKGVKHLYPTAERVRENQ